MARVPIQVGHSADPDDAFMVWALEAGKVDTRGLDLLPGYPFRGLSCAPAGFTDPAQAALCDRAIVTQAELRSRLRLRVPCR